MSSISPPSSSFGCVFRQVDQHAAAEPLQVVEAEHGLRVFGRETIQLRFVRDELLGAGWIPQHPGRFSGHPDERVSLVVRRALTNDSK